MKTSAILILLIVVVMMGTYIIIDKDLLHPNNLNAFDVLRLEMLVGTTFIQGIDFEGRTLEIRIRELKEPAEAIHVIETIETLSSIFGDKIDTIIFNGDGGNSKTFKSAKTFSSKGTE